MPLFDHFRPPLSQRRHWESFLAAWIEAIVRDLNESLLPDRYVAESLVRLGSQAQPDSFQVQVLAEEGELRLVAVIEFVSPANKSRPAQRRMFAVKCASYLQRGVSVVIVDVVTECAGNLHAELLQLLQGQLETPGQDSRDLYAAALRVRSDSDAFHLEDWVHALTVGATLPTLPLWLQADFCVPLDLEASYHAACVARRIAS